jgi:hypothetical protein
LSESELRTFCGDKFDSEIFLSLDKDDEGKVRRDDYLAEWNAKHEEFGTDHISEARNVFNAYCHNSGDLDSRTFIKLCKDLKFLNKKCNSGTADLIYQKAKTKNGTVSFDVFMNEILVDLAGKKEVNVQVLIGKLIRSDGPILHGTQAESVRFHDDKSTYTGAIAKNDNFKNDISIPNDDQQAAALKLQNIQRQKIAQKQVTEMREIKKSASNAHIPIVMESSMTETEMETKIRELFMKFCSTGEMDSRTFIKLCKDCHIIVKTFTSGDADLVFQKTKAMTSHPSAGSYSSGVIHGKRINYDVFRAITIPCIAEKKGITVSALLTHLSQQDGPQLHDVTTAESVRFHDDKTTYTGSHATAT